MQWFYIQNEQRIGPVDETELFRLAREGQLSPANLVWNSSMGQQWMPASSVPDLFALHVAQSSFPHIHHNRELMRMARESLRGNWALAVGVTLLYQLIMGGVQGMFPDFGHPIVKVIVSLASILIVLVIAGPMILGWNRFFLKIARRESAEVGRFFDGFKMFGKTFWAYVLMALYITLWSLLLIVPGIIAALSYAQTFFILSDHPEISATEALGRSKQMMVGFKWKLFCLGWRFFWWVLLSIFTCFIGMLWLQPYMAAANAHFYDDIRNGA